MGKVETGGQDIRISGRKSSLDRVHAFAKMCENAYLDMSILNIYYALHAYIAAQVII